jgi:adenine/guanine phosphoribosyltransferase-like PRPP-binding protein
MLYHNRADTSDSEYDVEACEDSYDLHGFDDAVRAAVRTLKPHAHEFDNIAVRGMSGVIMGAPVSLILKKELIVVRKPNEDNHQYRGNVINARVLHASPRCLFLDDLIAGGDTYYSTKEEIEKRGGEFVATYLYQYNHYEEGDR